MVQQEQASKLFYEMSLFLLLSTLSNASLLSNIIQNKTF